jgi:hypothetical protein
MQELELTWGQVVRIWWAAFWRWLIWGNLIAGFILGIIGIALWASGYPIRSFAALVGRRRAVYGARQFNRAAIYG